MREIVGGRNLKNNFLLVSVCNEKLHELEFVRPIEDILKKNKIDFFIRDYKKVNSKDLKLANKIILCGTSLFDNEFAKTKNLAKFKWLLKFDKPVLGICAGMQVLGLILAENKENKENKDNKGNKESKLVKKTEIGFYFEEFGKNFLGISGRQEVYHLHNYSFDFSKFENFEIFSGKGKVIQAVKEKTKPFYGVLFHPEVRQKGLISNFCNL